MFDKTRTEKGEFIAAWIDFSNAFGSVPLEAIFAGLEKIKAGTKIMNLIKNVYHDNTTRILTNTEPTNDINIESGIKQGCPISRLLFNIAIDPIIMKIQGQGTQHKILAYADDLVLIAGEQHDMQQRLNAVDKLAQKINFNITPSKSTSLHLSGGTPICTRDTTFHVKKSINSEPKGRRV
jgi:hypothetical protein